MIRARRLILLLAAGLCAGLGACATATSEARWTPRSGVDLAADQGECRKAAGGIDISAYGGQAYSDGRYGAAAAMANRLDRDSMRPGKADAVYQAVFEDCMMRKGWAKAQ